MSSQMGLGKTVQMISQMLMNKATDPKQKTTLILACVHDPCAFAS
jgi:SNF2 family DNA or RNA helicase